MSSAGCGSGSGVRSGSSMAVTVNGGVAGSNLMVPWPNRGVIESLGQLGAQDYDNQSVYLFIPS